jgi:hypothetical protein
VATTAFVASEMTDTVFALRLGTKTSPLAESTATPVGAAPTFTVATTVFVASD